jgi:hypothetical protein
VENRRVLATHIDTAIPWTINASLVNESLYFISLVAAMAEMTNPVPFFASSAASLARLASC